MMQQAEEIKQQIIRDFPDFAHDLEGLDSQYFDTFSIDQAIIHGTLLSALSDSISFQLHWSEDTLKEDSQLEIAIAAYDHPWLLSLLTGLLAASGFSISAGQIFTSKPGSGRQKILDVFQGSLDIRRSRNVWIAQFKEKLQEIFLLLSTNSKDDFERAKLKINESFVSTIPLKNSMENSILSAEKLEGNIILKITSDDVYGFLYTLSTALALQEISIEKVAIQTQGTRVLDEFVLRPRTEVDLENFKLSVQFTKRFTYFLTSAPDPFRALNRFEHILKNLIQHEHMELLNTHMQGANSLEDLARLLGASDYLWEDVIRTGYEQILPLLGSRAVDQHFSMNQQELTQAVSQISSVPSSLEEIAEKLNRLKDSQSFYIELDQILKPGFDILLFSQRLSLLAETILPALAEAVYLDLQKRYGQPQGAAGMPSRYSLLALGKLGGQALGYASDLELLFVFSDDGYTDGKKQITNQEFYQRVVQKILKLFHTKKQGLFHLDLRLRPHGSAGPLASTLNQFSSYYSSLAMSFEKLALIRMRHIGGDRELGTQIENIRDEILFKPDSLDVQELSRIRKKQIKEKAKTANAKFSPGALVDLEYTIQRLQCRYGVDHHELHTSSIRKALQALILLQIIPEETGLKLTECYHFFRNLINGLRMLRGSEADVYLPPKGSFEFEHLAKRMGYKKSGNLLASDHLTAEFETRTALVRTFVEDSLGSLGTQEQRPQSIADLILSHDEDESYWTDFLHVIGFRQPEIALENLKRLKSGHELLFSRLLTLVWEDLLKTPDRDLTLNSWERFTEAVADRGGYFFEMLQKPTVVKVLFQIFSASSYLSEAITRNPEHILVLARNDLLEAGILREDVVTELSVFDPRHSWPDRLRRFFKKKILEIATRDILGVPLEDILKDLSALADGILQWTLNRIWQEESDLPLQSAGYTLLAFGKLGGRELNYSSDIDLVAVFSGASSLAPVCKRVTERLIATLSSHSKEGFLYRIDFRLRPYGSAGPLVSSLESILEYYAEHAADWEIQAALRLRMIAGHGPSYNAIRKKVIQRMTSFQDIGKTGAGIERLRIQAIQRTRKQGIQSGKSEKIHIKDARGGIRDIEFLVQGLQLVHGSANESILSQNTVEALQLLQKARIVQADEGSFLIHSYQLFRKTEHLLQLEHNQQTHTLQPEKSERIAFFLKFNSGEALIEELRNRMKKVTELYFTNLQIEEKD
jgi:glutamate-ammonia-ligase adenylyltransferase